MPKSKRTEADELSRKVAPLPTGACECGRKSTSLAIAVLIVLILSHIWTNYLVLREDNTFFEDDRADLYILTTQFMNDVKTNRGFGVLRVLSKGLYTGMGEPDPPLFPALGALFLTIFGLGEDVGTMANAPAIVLLYVAVYLLGKRLFNRESGLLATILLIGFPGLLCLSRAYRPHYLSVGMITLSILLLVESEHMTNRKKSLAFGIVLGLTAMTNMPFSAFLVGPLVVEVLLPLAAALKERRSARARSIVINMALVAAICFAIAGPWYMAHMVKTFRLHGEVRPNCLFDPARERLDIRVGYFLDIVRAFGAVLFFPHLVAAAAASLFLIAVIKKERALLLSWILLPPLCLILLGLGGDTHVHIKDLLPSLPAVALIIASALVAIARRATEKKRNSSRAVTEGLISLLLIGEISLMLLISFRGSGDIFHPFGKAIIDRERYDIVNGYGMMSAHQLRFDISRSAEMLKNELAERNGTAVVFLLNQVGKMTVNLMWVNILPAVQREDLEIFTTECIATTYFDFVSLVRDVDFKNVSCEQEFMRADYAIIEAPTFNSHRMTEPIPEDVSSFGPWLRERMANATILDVLSFESKEKAPWERYLPGFEWVGEDAWILRLGNRKD